MISVIIPSYNRENTIFAAIKSVLDQTYKDLEVIVVDDGSTDNTKKVVSDIDDVRIRYIYQKNGGACSARNNGLRCAKGDYIAFHDSDDIWHKDKLETQMKALLLNNVDVVVCRMNSFINGEPYGVIPGNELIGFLDNVKDLQGIGTQTILGKKEVFDNIKFDTNMPRLQDLEWLIRANRLYKVYCLSDVLVDYYIGKDSISSNPEKLLRAIRLITNKYNIQNKYPNMAMSFAIALKESANLYFSENNILCLDFCKEAYKCINLLNFSYAKKIKLCLMRDFIKYKFRFLFRRNQ